MSKLDTLISEFKNAFDHISEFSNNQGYETRWLIEAKERLNEIENDKAQLSATPEKEAETIRVFFERRIKVPQTHKGTIKTLCQLNPDFHKALQGIHDKNIFREDNNSFLQKNIITNSLLAKSMFSGNGSKTSPVEDKSSKSRASIGNK